MFVPGAPAPSGAPLPSERSRQLIHACCTSSITFASSRSWREQQLRGKAGRDPSAGAWWRLQCSANTACFLFTPHGPAQAPSKLRYLALASHRFTDYAWAGSRARAFSDSRNQGREVARFIILNWYAGGAKKLFSLSLQLVIAWPSRMASDICMPAP